MRVRVDEAREHVLAGGVDCLRARRRREVPADLGDRLALAEDVRDVMLAGGDDLAVLDEQSHGRQRRTGPDPGKSKTFCLRRNFTRRGSC